MSHSGIQETSEPSWNPWAAASKSFSTKIEAAKENRLYAYWCVLLFGGLRPGQGPSIGQIGPGQPLDSATARLLVDLGGTTLRAIRAGPCGRLRSRDRRLGRGDAAFDPGDVLALAVDAALAERDRLEPMIRRIGDRDDEGAQSHADGDAGDQPGTA